VSDYIPDSGKEELGPYLTRQGIIFNLGADFNEELKPFGYVPVTKDKELKKVYTVLIEEHELTAIMLSVGGVQIIKNRNSINRLNKVRSMFSWILK
jgi:hypothetical protein